MRVICGQSDKLRMLRFKYRNVDFDFLARCVEAEGLPIDYPLITERL